MTRLSRLTAVRLPLILALLGALVSCGDDSSVDPDPSIDFLVGDWNAVRFEIAPQGSPGDAFDLLDQGGSFSINVQPSGQYTAQLTFMGVPAPPEIGFIEVDGDELVIQRTTPAPTTTTRAVYEEIASGRVVFSGPSEFDIDQNGTPEAITLEVEIVREN